MIVTHFTPAQRAAAPNVLAVVAHQRPRPSRRAAGIHLASVAGQDPLAATAEATTAHAWLVLLGHFARRLGLLDALPRVPIPQRIRDHAPQTKLIQFLVGILAGLDYLQDFTTAPHPLVQDPAVIASWGPPACAHSSSVSRTLEAADATTLLAVSGVLAQISPPFRAREIQTLIRQGQPLVIDRDLAGRPVSPTSTPYVDATFGWMDDAVQKGDQAVLTALSGGPTGRLRLRSQRLSGPISSADRLQAAILALEPLLGYHPRRRTGLVQARRQARAAQVRAGATALQVARAAEQRQWQTRARARTLRAPAQGTPARAGPGAARAQAALAQAARRVARVQRAYDQPVQPVQQAAATGWKVRQTATALRARLAALQQATTAVAPVPIVVRIDAGCSTAANLAWLIEMGSTIFTKAHNGQTTSRLRRTLEPQVAWTRVGGNAEAVRLDAQLLKACPYPLSAMLVRYQLPEEPLYTTLWYYGAAPAPADLQAWFRQYNGRQILEAGIKEGKAVLTLRRPLVRSPIGMHL